MKITALFLMFLGVLFILGFGFAFLLLFAMSFDAPGSIGTLGVWAIHLFIFLLLLIFMATLIFSAKAYRAGNYTRSVGFGSVFGLAVFGSLVFLGKASNDTLQDIQATNAQEAEDARLYPMQQFIRPVEGGADTVIVFPSRIVAYRLYVQGGKPFAGPIGDLNATRDTILVNNSEFDRKMKRQELNQFVDDKGRRLTEVFGIR